MPESDCDDDYDKDYDENRHFKSFADRETNEWLVTASAVVERVWWLIWLKNTAKVVRTSAHSANRRRLTGKIKSRKIKYFQVETKMNWWSGGNTLHAIRPTSNKVRMSTNLIATIDHKVRIFESKKSFIHRWNVNRLIFPSEYYAKIIVKANEEKKEKKR